jgi:hypothetical protein
MGNVSMTVDELAGRNLLLALGLDADESHLALAADHMRAHRMDAQRFDAAKVREELLAHLERAFLERVHPDDGAWSAGYAAAEREALNWAADREQMKRPPAPKSTGAHLRSMIRTARQRSAPTPPPPAT